LKAQQSGLSGTVEGIGALLSSQNEQPIVQSVVPGGPADRAGLRSGDRIVAIDGESVAGLSLDEIVTRVRGEPGTSVTVSVIRDAGAPIDVTILRETVTVPATTWTIVPGTTTALIRLEQFSTGSADQLKESIKASREAGATGILLDLRENPGGYVNEAVTIASQFLRDGTVYLSQDAKGARTPTAVEPGGLALDTPLVVLVNGGSASSSEIVAGALKDAGRARLVGTRTFGTGTVLGQFALSDGSALMIGTIQWLTPKGNEIWHQGITPDVVIDMPSGGRVLAPTDVAKLDPANLLSAGDPQLVEALKVIASIQRTSEPASLLFRRAA